MRAVHSQLDAIYVDREEMIYDLTQRLESLTDEQLQDEYDATGRRKLRLDAFYDADCADLVNDALEYRDAHR